MRFEASEATASALRAIRATNADSPFCSEPYALACGELGARPVVLGLLDDALVEGTLAFVWRGRLSARIEIPTAPTLKNPDLFWRGVKTYCDERNVSLLTIDTYASKNPTLPDSREWQGAIVGRSEFVLQLEQGDLLSAMSSNHKRNVKKAMSAGVKMITSDTDSAIVQHLPLMRASMTRRRSRGEDVALPESDSFQKALVKRGAGKVHQAILNEKVLSSILILRNEVAGYYHSAGTSPEGMSIGASQFLIHEVAMELARDGLEILNLGGAAPDASGLRRFKESFGAQEIELSAAQYVLASRQKAFLRRLLQAIRLRR